MLIHAAQRQGALVGQGEEVLHELRLAQHRAAGVLDDAAAVRVPGAGGLSPEEVLRRALGAWSEIVKIGKRGGDLYQQFKDWSDPLLSGQNLVTGGAQVALARKILQEWRAAQDAATLLRQTLNLEDAKVGAVLRVVGDAGDYRVLKQYFQSAEIVSQVRSGSQAAEEALGLSKTAFLDSVIATSRFAKVTGVLSVVSGAVDLVAPQHDGWRGTGDRVAGGVSIAAGGAALLAGAGVITLGTVGAPVVAAALAATALWAGGNFVYDHWDDITHGLGVAKDWVADKGEWVGGKVSEGAGFLEKKGSGLVHSIGGLFG